MKTHSIDQTKLAIHGKLLLILVTTCFLLCSKTSNAQFIPPDTSGMIGNFYEFQNRVLRFYDSTGLDTIKGSGFKDFLRWSRFWSDRTGYNLANNNNASLEPAQTAYWNYYTAGINNSIVNLCEGSFNSNNWTYSGHLGITGNGKGRVEKVKVDPIDPNRVYVGANNAGLWVTENINADPPVWTNLTDNHSPRVPILGIKDIEIDPHGNNLVYIATGYNGGSQSGIGFLKSFDKGVSFNQTSLTLPMSDFDNNLATCILIRPKANDTSNIVLVGANSAIHRSTDGGMNFEMMFNLKTAFIGGCKD
ncbi:MAG: hypothetical protein IT243_08705 [Bacteroidia bacterium]|nr:hypothetical protein [Bacteroidia bacterium]